MYFTRLNLKTTTRLEIKYNLINREINLVTKLESSDLD